mgnify:CR=1 FL=1
MAGRKTIAITLIIIKVMARKMANLGVCSPADSITDTIFFSASQYSSIICNIYINTAIARVNMYFFNSLLIFMTGPFIVIVMGDA